MPYYERRTKSGRLMEIDRYFATRDGRRVSRSPNVEETDDNQQRLNDVQAANRLRRLMLANFDPEQGDMFVTLTMGRITDREEAERAWRRWIAKVGRARERRQLPEAKWIKIPEQQSGRWHYHLIMSGGITLDELQRMWGMGNRVHASVLDVSDNYRGLSRYLTQAEKHRRGCDSSENAKAAREKNKRRWSCSKNLAKPETTKRVIAERTVRQLPKAPKGYRLLPEWTVGTDKFGCPFMHCECIIDSNAAAPKAPRKKQQESGGRAGRGRGGPGAAAPGGSKGRALDPN